MAQPGGLHLATARIVLAGLSEPAVITDGTGVILADNTAFATAVRPGAAGASLVDLADDAGECRRALALWSGSTTVRPARLRINGADLRGDGARLSGAPEHLLIRLRTTAQATEPFREIGRSVDIHALERTKVRLREALAGVETANVALRTANDMLERFAGVISHDLRTPLAGIVGTCELLVHTVDADDRELVDVIRRYAIRMRRQIEGLLTLARAGATPPPAGRVDAREALTSAVGLLATDLEQHGATVDARGELPDLPLTEAEAVQVLQNLVQNAVVHAAAITDAPTVVVAGGREGGQVWLSVEDDGPGIPVDERARVLEPFARGAQVQAPGSGIGLAACSAIVTARGGELVLADSAALGGAEVRVVLPDPTADDT